MGTNAAIPLSFQSPQVQPFTQALGQAYTLRDLQMRAQMAPEQLHALQTENEQRDLQLKLQQQQYSDQQIIRQAMIDEANALRAGNNQPAPDSASPAATGSNPPSTSTAPAPGQDILTAGLGPTPTVGGLLSGGPSALAPARSTPMAAEGSVPPGGDYFSRVIARAQSNGASPMALSGLYETQLKLRDQAAKLTETEANIHKLHGAAIAQEAYGLMQLSPEDLAQQYPQAIDRLVQRGVINPQQAAQMRGRVPTKADLEMWYASGTAANEVGNLAINQQKEQRTFDDQRSKEIQTELANVRSQQELDDLRAQQKAKGTSQSIIDAYVPRTWTPGFADKYAANLVPPQDRAKIPGESAKSNDAAAEDLSKQLANVQTVGQYNRIRNNPSVPDAVRNRFPDLGQYNDSEPIGDNDRDRIHTAGLTSEEQTRAAETHEFHEENMALRRELGENSAGRAKYADQKEISNLADQAIQLSKQGAIAAGQPDKGGSLQEAMADVMNPNLYTDHRIGEVRGQVWKELNSRLKSQTGISNTENEIANRNNQMANRGNKGGFTFRRPPGSNAPPPPQQRPAAPSPTRNAAPPPSGNTPSNPPATRFTEAQVRARVAARNANLKPGQPGYVDPDAYVRQARGRGLIQ